MEQINAKKAPDAIGPYCHAIKSGNLLFCSGQIALEPETMKLSGKTIEEQTKKVFQNISLVLGQMNLGLKNIVKTTVFLKDMNDFQGMNKVYEKMLEGHKPARTTISVKQNPMDALVEIECIAEF